MWHYLESIRRKSKPVRAMYAFWGAAIFTAAVIMVWSLSLPPRILAVIKPAEKADIENPSQLWSGLQDYGFSLKAAVIGAFTDLGTSTDPKTENEKANTGTSSVEAKTGVWQRTYEERKGGQVILIATSSKSTATTTSLP